MCKFDKVPVWNYTADEECKGEWSTWYYIYLVIAHSYFLLEFMLRVSIQKYKDKFLLTLDSFIEIFTTVPFLICMPIFGV